MQHYISVDCVDEDLNEDVKVGVFEWVGLVFTVLNEDKNWDVKVGVFEWVGLVFTLLNEDWN